MARRGRLDGWTVVHEYHPELDPDGASCASALADLYQGLKKQALRQPVNDGKAPRSVMTNGTSFQVHPSMASSRRSRMASPVPTWEAATWPMGRTYRAGGAAPTSILGHRAGLFRTRDTAVGQRQRRMARA